MPRRPSPMIANARLTLLERATHLTGRARRARVGSNERRKCLAQAQLLSGCVHEIDHDRTLRQHLEKTGAAGSGWRGLADAVVTHARKRAREKFGA